MEKNTLATANGKNLTVDTPKNDKYFVEGMGKDPESTARVAARLSRALPLGPEVTAEGRETIVQIELMQQVSCAQGRGCRCAGTLPAEAAERIPAGHLRWQILSFWE